MALTVISNFSFPLCLCFFSFLQNLLCCCWLTLSLYYHCFALVLQPTASQNTALLLLAFLCDFVSINVNAQRSTSTQLKWEVCTASVERERISWAIAITQLGAHCKGARDEQANGRIKRN